MRENMCEKFTNNAIVRPLYKKVRNNKRKVQHRKDFVSINIGSTVKLCGDGINVKRKVYKQSDCIKNSLILEFPKNNIIEDIPGTCESVRKENDHHIHSRYKYDNKVLEVSSNENVNNSFMREAIGDCIMTDATSSRNPKYDDVNKEYSCSDNVKDSADRNQKKVPDSWLRVFPCPKTKGESIQSVVFRCAACQLGLATFLVLWNLVWVFIIQHFEGPYELKVSSDFQREQDQLVIDLATELRQITPLSPKWRGSIEARIAQARLHTMAAAGQGVRLLPGHFWDLPGTFLFTIYVLTALGFGAPVPHTTDGRTCALIYAALAVPTHIYLMMNAGRCVIAHMDRCIGRMKQCLRPEAPIHTGNTVDTTTDDPVRIMNLESIKARNRIFRRKIWCIINMLSIRSCVPLACVLYYTLGALGFGWLRGKTGLEIAMFPLEFTTSGGLEKVECHMRIVYGFYVEGAMCLLSLTLATIRRHSSAGVNSMARHYRLFVNEKCDDDAPTNVDR